MYFLYVIRNKATNELYYGYTNNLERRLVEHNKDAEWELIYYEAYKNELDARDREKSLKHYGQGRAHLKNRIKRSLTKEN